MLTWFLEAPGSLVLVVVTVLNPLLYLLAWATSLVYRDLVADHGDSQRSTRAIERLVAALCDVENHDVTVGVRCALLTTIADDPSLSDGVHQPCLERESDSDSRTGTVCRCLGSRVADAKLVSPTEENSRY